MARSLKMTLAAIATLVALTILVLVMMPNAPTDLTGPKTLQPLSKSKDVLEIIADSAGVEYSGERTQSLPPNHPPTNSMQSSALPSVGEMAINLRQRLEAEPSGGSPQGWYLLGRTYMELKNYNEAVYAFEQTLAQAPEHLPAMVSLADALSMQAGGAYSQKARDLINQALEIDPTNQNAKWMAGNIQVQQGNPQAAISLWRELLPLLEGERKQQLQLQITTVEAVLEKN